MNKKKLQKRGNEYIATQEIIGHKTNSPLPVSDELERYNAINSTFPERILRLAEKNHEFVKELSFRDSRQNFLLKSLIILGGLAVAGYCAFLNLQLAAGAIAVTALGGGAWGLRNIFRLKD